MKTQKVVVSTLQDKSLFDFDDRGIKAIIREPEDICSSRHRGNEASIEANKRVNKVRDRQKVIEALEHFGGVSWSKQIADYLKKPLNCISGRISGLKAEGRVVVLKDEPKKDGCEILRLLEAQ